MQVIRRALRTMYVGKTVKGQEKLFFVFFF
jgi:hypothetical protein